MINAIAIMSSRYESVTPKGIDDLYAQLDTEMNELKALKKLRNHYFCEWIGCLFMSGKILAQAVSEQRDQKYCYVNEVVGPSARRSMKEADAGIVAKCQQIESTIKDIDRRWYPNRKHTR
jgi:hypothetical protein